MSVDLDVYKLAAGIIEKAVKGLDKAMNKAGEAPQDEEKKDQGSKPEGQGAAEKSLKQELEEQMKSEEEPEENVFTREISDEQIRNEILKFKMQVNRVMPFYGDVMMKLSFVENKHIPTACTDGLVVYYNPNFFRKQTQGQMNFIIMH